jgi:hypothetical protein
MQFSTINKHIIAIILSYVDGDTFSNLMKTKIAKKLKEACLVMEELYKFKLEFKIDDETFLKYMTLRGREVCLKTAKHILSENNISLAPNMLQIQKFDFGELYLFLAKIKKEREKRKMMLMKIPYFNIIENYVICEIFAFMSDDMEFNNDLLFNNINEKDETDNYYCKIVNTSKRYEKFYNNVKKFKLETLMSDSCCANIYYGYLEDEDWIDDEEEIIEQMCRYKYLLEYKKGFKDLYNRYKSDESFSNDEVFGLAEAEIMYNKEYPKIWPWMQPSSNYFLKAAKYIFQQSQLLFDLFRIWRTR